MKQAPTEQSANRNKRGKRRPGSTVTEAVRRKLDVARKIRGRGLGVRIRG